MHKRRGGAMLEMALLAPWIFFLFIGALDWGFYAYSMISIETAARTAASSIARQGSTAYVTDYNACSAALPELSTLSNMSSVTTCDASPLVVSATTITSVDGNNAVQVSLTYTTPSMIPIPGLLAKNFTITRIVKMRI